MTQTNEAMETKPENVTRAKALRLFEGNKNETFDKSTHHRDTTLKHIKDPDVTQRMAGHDIKPGIAGYRDRIALLNDAKAKGKLKEEVEALDEKFVETHLKSGKPNPNHPAYNKHKVAYDAEKAASKPARAAHVPEENPIKMHHIDAAISNSFPDVEPYDHLARKFPHLHRQDHATKGTKLTYWADKTVAAHDKKHKTLSSYSDAAYKDMHDDKLMGEAQLDELAIDTVKSYKAKVAGNPAPSKTTSDILHKAIRRFAGKERAEDRIHSDEMKKMRERLGIKTEETLEERDDREDDEGYARTKDADDEWNKKLGHTPPVPKPTPARKRVPIDIWKKKPGVDEEVVTEDDAQKHMSNAMDNIHPDHRPAARKLYNSARAKGLPHAASLNIMHDRFGGTNEEVVEEGLDDLIKGVKRKIAGKESPEDVKYRRYLDTVKDNMAGKDVSKSMRRLGKVTKVVNKEGADREMKKRGLTSEEASIRQIQREILEETGQLLSLVEVKYMVENANGGIGAIAKHAGVDGEAPEGTGKVKKMMGNKTDIKAIAKIITGTKPKEESN